MTDHNDDDQLWLETVLDGLDERSEAVKQALMEAVIGCRPIAAPVGRANPPEITETEARESDAYLAAKQSPLTRSNSLQKMYSKSYVGPPENLRACVSYRPDAHPRHSLESQGLSRKRLLARSCRKASVRRRAIGYARAVSKIGMSSLAYSLQRLAWIVCLLCRRDEKTFSRSSLCHRSSQISLTEIGR